MIEISRNEAHELINVLEEQVTSYWRCILNLVGEREMWEALIAQDEALIEKLRPIASENTRG